MKRRLGLSALLIAFFCGSAFAGEGWMRASAEFRREGVEFVVCNNVAEQILCLGLSCRGGYELISLRSGSGPFTGKARVTTASGSFATVFSEEFETIGGVSSPRAKICREDVRAIASSRRISIEETHPEPDTDRFSSANLSRLLKSSRSACPPLD